VTILLPPKGRSPFVTFKMKNKISPKNRLSIFRYPGGKSRVLDKIFKKMPTFSEYRECMVGGGSVFFSIDKSVKRWINDMDEDLISVYLALRDTPSKFINKCREILPHKKEELVSPPIYNVRLRNIFNNIAFDSDAYQPLRYFIINRLGWGGRVRFDIKSRIYFSNYKGWNIVNSGKLEKVSEILQGVKITSYGYEKLLSKPGKNVLIYIDPPYYKNTLLAESSKLYRHNFTIEDHKKLAENVKVCKHKVIISYDDNNFIRSLYDNFNIYEEQWSYCGSSSGKNQSKTKRKGKELIITNFDTYSTK